MNLEGFEGMPAKSKPDLTWQQISAFRLARHNLLAPTARDLVAISRTVCGIQAQVMSSAHLAVWARAHQLSRADIALALNETRSLVKTLCMRRTLHLVPSDEFPVYISALRPSRMAALMRVMSMFGITQKEVELLNGAFVEALGSGPMTRAELNTLVRPRMNQKIRAWMDRVSSSASPALTDGLVCYGPDNGKEVRFVRVDQWLPRQCVISEREAKRILFRKYLSAYGPATLNDMAYWSGMPMKEVREIPALLDGELTGVRVGDRSGLVLTSQFYELMRERPAGHSVRLLPGFDPYMLGHADKTPLVSSEHYKLVYRNQGWISPVVLVNGKVVATWSSTRRARLLSIEIQPLEKLSKTIWSMVEKEAEGLGGFLESPVEIKSL